MAKKIERVLVLNSVVNDASADCAALALEWALKHRFPEREVTHAYDAGDKRATDVVVQLVQDPLQRGLFHAMTTYDRVALRCTFTLANSKDAETTVTEYVRQIIEETEKA